MPRVSFGSLEEDDNSTNFTCPGSQDIQQWAREQQQQQHAFPFLSTLRYQYHAIKTDFSKNKFGKVLLNLSNFSNETLQNNKPRNIHRPYPKQCWYPHQDITKAPFYLMHYAGRYERIQHDQRRGSYDNWYQRASVMDSTECCEQQNYRWLPRFVNQVGLERAQFLFRPKR